MCLSAHPLVVFGFAFEGLLAYDLRAGRSTLIAVGDSPDEGDPYDIEVHPTGNAVVVTKVYRCCHPEPSGEVSWLDLRSGYSTLLASGLDQPLGLALHPRGNAAFVAEFGTGRLLRVDFDTRAVSVVATGLSGPTGVAVDRSGAFAVVTEVGTGELSTVDLTVDSVTTIASGLGRPYGVDLSPSGTTAYVSVASASGSRLCAIGLATGSVSTVATGVSGDVELDPAGRSAFVGSSGALWQVDLASGSVTRLPGFGNQKGTAVACDPPLPKLLLRGRLTPFGATYCSRSHLITDPCSGAETGAFSTTVDLSAYSFGDVCMEARSHMVECLDVEVGSIRPLSSPACAIEVLGVETMREGSSLEWGHVPCASAYDLIRGQVGNLSAGAAALDLGPVSCLANDLGAVDKPIFTGPADLDIPTPGQAFFYLVRPGGQLAAAR